MGRKRVSSLNILITYSRISKGVLTFTSDSSLSLNLPIPLLNGNYILKPLANGNRTEVTFNCKVELEENSQTPPGVVKNISVGGSLGGSKKRLNKVRTSFVSHTKQFNRRSDRKIENAVKLFMAYLDVIKRDLEGEEEDANSLHDDFLEEIYSSHANSTINVSGFEQELKNYKTWTTQTLGYVNKFKKGEQIKYSSKIHVSVEKCLGMFFKGHFLYDVGKLPQGIGEDFKDGFEVVKLSSGYGVYSYELNSSQIGENCYVSVKTGEGGKKNRYYNVFMEGLKIEEKRFQGVFKSKR